MKYCTNCGTQNPDNAVYCSNCGQEFRDNTVYNGSAYAYGQPSKPASNGFAIAGFVCSFFIPLLGWIFGGIGLSRSKNLDGKGRGMAIAALVIATVNFLIGFIFMMTQPSTTAIHLLF
jgi:hypothetical protein